ncbi:MAG TPA: crossover junction endodeoxyribonuclease RuvC [Gemmatimonadales bacterium]|nr:crossover junction endodeoxyribonuclease RuvC [Gemmatimonadales bacterium]
MLPAEAAVRVLGIDPGTAILGYGVVESRPNVAARLVECGVLRTRARDPLPARLRLVHDGIAELIDQHRPDTVAVETAFFAKNARTTMVMSHARGVILLAVEEAGLPVAEYSPAVVKKTVVGRGAARKPQVGYMVAQLLRLARPPAPADAADGVAIALTHLLLATRGQRTGAKAPATP